MYYSHSELDVRHMRGAVLVDDEHGERAKVDDHSLLCLRQTLAEQRQALLFGHV